MIEKGGDPTRKEHFEDFKYVARICASLTERCEKEEKRAMTVQWTYDEGAMDVR